MHRGVDSVNRLLWKYQGRLWLVKVVLYTLAFCSKCCSFSLTSLFTRNADLTLSCFESWILLCCQWEGFTPNLSVSVFGGGLHLIWKCDKPWNILFDWYYRKHLSFQMKLLLIIRRLILHACCDIKASAAFVCCVLCTSPSWCKQHVSYKQPFCHVI